MAGSVDSPQVWLDAVKRLAETNAKVPGLEKSAIRRTVEYGSTVEDPSLGTLAAKILLRYWEVIPDYRALLGELGAISVFVLWISEGQIPLKSSVLPMDLDLPNAQTIYQSPLCQIKRTRMGEKEV